MTPGKGTTGGVPSSVSSVLKRSPVPAGLKYGEYRPSLRRDFFYLCAYCGMSEAEAHGIGFEIDHYEPRKARPDLENEYANLMYSCEVCNVMKGDRCPPEKARAQGHRFFRPDEDIYDEHFRTNGIRLEHKSNVGNYSIWALHLNRLSLRKLRELRKRLMDCAPVVNESILALRRFQLDQIPPHARGLALIAIKRAEAAQNQMAEAIDDLLRGFARSALIDPDPDADAQAEERASELMKLQALFPGKWRAPRGQQQASKSKT